MSAVPAYVRVAELAEACGMDVDDMRDMLQSAPGLLVRHRGQRFWVSTDRLRDTFNDAYTRLYDKYDLQAEEAARLRRVARR